MPKQGQGVLRALSVETVTELDDIRRRFDALLPDGARWNTRATTLLAVAQQQADRVRVLRALVDTDGPMVPGSTGQMRLHPALSELRLLESALVRTLEGISLPSDEDSKRKSVKHQRAAGRRWKE